MIKIHNNKITLSKDFGSETDMKKIENLLKIGCTFEVEDDHQLYLSKKKNDESLSEGACKTTKRNSGCAYKTVKRNDEKISSDFLKYLKNLEFCHRTHNPRAYNKTFYKICDLLKKASIDSAEKFIQQFEKNVWDFSKHFGEATALRKEIRKNNKAISEDPCIKRERKKYISLKKSPEQLSLKKIESENITSLEKMQTKEDDLHQELIDIYQSKNFNFKIDDLNNEAMDVSIIPSIFYWSDAFSRQEDDSDPAYLVMGLDIGTSTTKIVIREAFVEDKQRFYPVHFGELADKNTPFLLPTRLTVSTSGQFYIPLFDQSAFYTNLKLEFINNESYLFEVYIALVIQYAQRWFFREYGDNDLYKGKSFVWKINLGAPFNKCEKNKKESPFYQALTKAYAWSQQPQILKDRLETVENINNNVELDVIPEFAAEIQSYLTSHEREDGVHLMVDVGAGTLDCSTFFLYENKVSIFSTETPFLGGKIYELFLSKAVECSVNMDTTTKIKDDIEFKEKYPEKAPQFETRKEVFLNECREYIGRCLKKAREKSPNDANHWSTSTPLPTILCGGGKNIEVYKNVLKERGLYDKNIKQINRDISYQGSDVNLIDQDRMFVAHGLSLLGWSEKCELNWPDELEDIKDDRKKTDIYSDNPTGKAGGFD